MLHVADGVFVPESKPGLMEEIDRRWHALCESNPAYFDGRLYHVLGVHRNGHGGAVLHVIDCAYRFHAVQDDTFDVGMRALGLKGIVTRDNHYLLGQRSNAVAAYKGMWEFAPSGSMEPERNPAEVIQKELLEETGLQTRHEPIAIAVLFDPVLRCWELLYQLEILDHAISPQTNEYSQLDWRTLDQLPQLLSPVAQQIAKLLRQNGLKKPLHRDLH